MGDVLGDDAAPPERASAQFKIGGMTCGACVASIETMLGQQDGIYSVSVALLAERAVVEYDPSRFTPEKIVDEIDDIGFDAEVVRETDDEHVTLSVFGMTCASCTSSVEQGLLAVPGVLAASVSLALQQVQIHFDKSKTNVRQLVQEIEDIGFDALLVDQRDTSQINSLTRVQEVHEWRHAFFFSLSFAVPVFLLSMALPHLGIARGLLHAQVLHGIYVQDLLCLLLTIPVQFGIAQRFFVPAYKAFKHGGATMDTLVILGTSASWAFSVVAMLVAFFCAGECHKPATFFDTSTMLITFVSLGRYLENLAKGRTSEALTHLMRLTPNKATIYTDDARTQTREIPAELLQVGDMVRVVPGEKIAADGVVHQGCSAVDESMITGEPVPVDKGPQSQVIGGTVNGSGSLDFCVTRAGKDTSLSQIVRLVQDAQVNKAPIQDAADRIAGMFVPCILLLSMVTFVAWFVVSYIFPAAWRPPLFERPGANKIMECFKLCISVIVVACPCALGLSTPTAMMVGTGVGASHGILIKGGSSLEAACSIAHVVFDKTGTLTRGKLRVQATHWAGTDDGATRLDAPCVASVTQSEVLGMVGAAEQKSEHVLGRTLVHHAEQLVTALPTVSSFHALHGSGIEARIETRHGTHTVLVGNAAMVGGKAALRTTLLDTTGGVALLRFVDDHESDGCTIVYASIDGHLACAFALADTLKPEARQAVQMLQDMGILCSMMTGDTAGTAHAVADMVGILPDNVHAQLSPNGKMVLLERQRAAMHQKEREMDSSLLARLRAGFALFLPAPHNGLAMVGDGVNDSPALAYADVGMALCSGSDIAMDAASIVLMRDDLLDVPISLLLCRRIFLQIRLNFLWATMYNVVMVPLAMGCLLPWSIYLHPMMAGAAMACSSISVVLSSLSLKRWQRPTLDAAPTMTLFPPLHAAVDMLQSAVYSLLPRSRRVAQEYTALEMA